MKKRIQSACLTMVVCSIAHAGGMGAVSDMSHTTTPFIGLEGSYTWNQINGPVDFGLATKPNKNGWGGRLSVGAVRPYTDKFSFTGEFGGGYYGSVRTQSPAAGLTSAKITLDGYDFLVGGMYRVSNFGLFGEMGAMVENMRIGVTQDLSLRFPGEQLSGVVSSSVNRTQMLPELKVGGVYNVYDNLDLSLSYMYVFGHTVSQSTSRMAGPAPTEMTLSGNSSMQNTTLSTLLLGLRYNFA